MDPVDAGDTNSDLASNYNTDSGCSQYGKPNSNQFSMLHNRDNCTVQCKSLGHKIINVRAGNQNKLTSSYHSVTF